MLLLLLAIFFELFGQKEIESNESIMVAGHYKLAMVYLNGDGVERDYQQAFKWLTQAANLGHPESQYNLGWMYADGNGVSQNYKEAVRLFRLATEKGQLKAQYYLGLMYADGTGVTQDFVYAYMWWIIAASNGFLLAKKSKTNLARKMTSSQIEEAQRLSKECMKKDYKGC